MITHLIHSSVLAVLFYGVYHLLLRKETFFQWNRAYLLLLPLLSICIPFISVPFYIDLGLNSETDSVAINSSTAVIADLLSSDSQIQYLNKNALVTVKPSLNNAWLVLWIYLIGVLISTVVFLVKLDRIIKWTQKGQLQYLDGVYLTKTKTSLTAFSFLNYIIVDDTIIEDSLSQIIAHESIHIKQKHSWDLIYYELLRIFFWFHPFSYFIQNELKIIHEFIVDEQLCIQENTVFYQENLLKTAFNCPNLSFTSSYLNVSILKNRIKMLQKRKSTNRSLFKLTLIVPVILISMLYTACTTKLDPQDVEKIEEIVEIADFNLPLYSKFKLGEKDFYKNVSKEDSLWLSDNIIKMSKSFQLEGTDSVSIRKHQDAIFTFIKSEDGQKSGEILKIINQNGTTIVINDTKTPQDIMTIRESYTDDKVTYEGFPTQYQTGMSDEKYEAFKHWALGKFPQLASTIILNESISTDFNGDHLNTVYTLGEIDTYPSVLGCGNDSVKKNDCVSKSINDVVYNNFNTAVAGDLTGKIKITAQFHINKKGHLSNIKVRAPSPSLEKETRRVLLKVPEFIPASINGENVTVVYALPILLELK